MTKNFPFTTALIGLLLLANSCWSAALRRSGRRHLQEDIFETGAYRVEVSPFHLVLAPVAAALDEPGLDDLFGIVQQLIEEYVQQQVSNTSESLQYVYLRDMSGTFRNEQTTLSFPKGGIALFSGAGSIDRAQLDKWTQEALEFALPSVLQNGAAMDSLLDTVEFSVYLGSSEDRPEEETPDSTGIQDAPASPSSKNSSEQIIIIVVVLAVALAVIVVVVLLITRRLPSKDAELEPSSREIVGPSIDADPSLSSRPALERTLSSGERSESSFTVNTEAGDSTALKSVQQNSSLNELVGMIEPFEHDRMQINVRKDMLSSTWVGEKSIANANLPPQMDSVLAPSHFAATKEEEDRRLRMHEEAQAEAWDLEEENDAALRFESAHTLDEPDEDDDAFLDSQAQI